MKVSDYVVGFIESVTDSLFLLSGGGIMHLIDSVGKSKKLHAVCCHHEQAAAIAAEGYARIKNNVGVALVTTGPGGTNAITGVAGAWLDSVPVLVIGGQVKTDNITPRKNGALTVRAIGFQELNCIDMVKPITKYAATVEEKEDIRYHLEKAVYLARTGRPGPVWVEIPLDIQDSDINPEKIRGFSPPSLSQFTESKIPMDLIVSELKKAKRPLLLAGSGIRLAWGEKILWKVLNQLKINAATVIINDDDLITNEYEYYLGRQGIPGNETANWAIDNCDLLLVIGDRLQLTQLSYDYANFATQAMKIMVDIDENELHKKTVDIDIPVCADAKVFLEELYKRKIKLHRWNIQVKTINPRDFIPHGNYVNIYAFLNTLAKHSKKYHVATADGMASLGPHQALAIRRGQRFITNAGLGHMGSGLPYAIGVGFASNKEPVICMEGDGSLMLNIQELQTVFHHNLPIKLFIWNNNGYYSIRTTHLNYFKKEFASSPETGVSFQDFEKIIKAWGFAYRKIANNKDLDKVEEIMNYKGPIVCELVIDPNQPMPSKWTAGMYRGKKLP